MMTRRTASAGLVTSAILTAAAFAQTVGYPARLESHFRWSETQRPYWLAGAPLQIAPCSARFPERRGVRSQYPWRPRREGDSRH